MQTTLFATDNSNSLSITEAEYHNSILKKAFAENDIRKLESFVLERLSNNKQQIFPSSIDTALVYICKLATPENSTKATYQAIRYALSSPSYVTQLLAVRAIGTIKNPEFLSILLDLYHETVISGYHDVRIEIIKTVGHLGDNRATRILIHALHRGVFEVPAALISLAQVGDLSAIPIMEHLLEYKDYINKIQTRETIKVIKEKYNVPLDSIMLLNWFS
ncbi:hypothetical protein Metho_2649 (plasmid) [Methanomethylovorans hollandica DSM 15978]|uniref:HEAT repeat domain-containing protein n=1 Tax=Methanomethylovorans hollandica (strain DSM 15978 / NBRC 107637 / DMS1) TaxID=867904 RepID=L0L3A3_METHD|nr:HEAT repeat domain-containing protein [Methanomethylovorans hollandica]AGB50779.1 hypothetical protein Metho_2649 [Methanomethylovorans hollandica DSM 15978]